MKTQVRSFRFLLFTLSLLFSSWTPALLCGQAVPYARTFPKPKEEVEVVLKEMQAYAGQKLPIVDGFVAAGDEPLGRFERAFYLFSIELVSNGPAATIVRLTAKITAWYADSDPSKSGYQVLPSNGRLELDLLDRLSDKLGGKPLISSARSSVLAPTPKVDFRSGSSGKYATSDNETPAGTASASGEDEISSLRHKREAEEKRVAQLNAELQNLQEIQRSQARPGNLVTVKKSGTPVLGKPVNGSHVLFTAAENDEFEFLDSDGEWIHVQISGASRGYIRRNGLELPEFLAAQLKSPNLKQFEDKEGTLRVAREESGTFPGNWDLLRGKMVKIYTVQPVSSRSKGTQPAAKLEFAESLFRRFSSAPAGAADSVEGLVVIFDSADGGIVATTRATAQAFANGSLSTDAFWSKCYTDPPDAFR